MRSRISSWNETITKLGFKRKKRKNCGKNNAHRALRLESLETRQLMAVDSFQVDNSSDVADGIYTPGNLTLREAITRAEADPDLTTITFSESVNSILLSNGQMTINSEVQIIGNGVDSLSIDAQGLHRVFGIDDNAEVTISDVTLHGGYSTNGGGAVVIDGDLTLNNVLVEESESTSSGGGVYVNSIGSLKAVDSTFRNNTSSGSGGAISGHFGAGLTLDITGSTFYDNTASTGGAVKVQGSNGGSTTLVSITNSTFSDNTGNSGGAMNFQSYTGSPVEVSIINSTVYDNEALTSVGGGIYNVNPDRITVGLHNTVLAGNTAANTNYHESWGNINGTVSNPSSYNLIGIGNGNMGITHLSNNNRVGTSGTPLDPLLGVLADNGGPTLTHAPLTNSPLLDQGSAAIASGSGPTTDQRGNSRTYDVTSVSNGAGGTTDIGAFELIAAAIVASQEFEIDENSADGTIVGQVASSPSVGTSQLNWAIVSGGGTTFTINEHGQIVILDNTALDFEQNESFVLGVQVNDGSYTSSTVNVTVNVRDVINQSGDPMIVDNSHAGFDTEGTWTSGTGTTHGSDQLVADAAPGNTATWTFNNLPTDNTYGLHIYVTWDAIVDAAGPWREVDVTTHEFAGAWFEIRDANGDLISGKIPVNLSLDPSGPTVEGSKWNYLSSISTNDAKGDHFTVTLQGTESGKKIVADAVRLSSGGPINSSTPMPSNFYYDDALPYDPIAHLKWTRPSGYNTIPLHGYEIQMSENGIDGWQYYGGTSAYSNSIINRVFLQKEYFRIRSLDFNNGHSEWSPITKVSDADASDENQVVKVSAETSIEDNGSGSEGAVTLNWQVQLDQQSSTWAIDRRVASSTSWTGTEIASSITVSNPNQPWLTYTDTDVAIGTTYEYRVRRTGTVNATGYVVAGVARPIVESRGKVILIVDTAQAVALANELARLEKDLVGDGWTVIRHNYASVSNALTGQEDSNDDGDRVREVKDIIQAEYILDPTNVKSVLLFGDIPVPYSGNGGPEFFGPDGHGKRTLPADVFYGDVHWGYTSPGVARAESALWTDAAVQTPNFQAVPSYSTDHAKSVTNVIGDGRFDQDIVPNDGDGTPIELSVGRIDFSNLPAFGSDPEFDEMTVEQIETELLRRYLDKDHAFRQGEFDLNYTANVAADRTDFNTKDAWLNYSPLVGQENVEIGNWLRYMDDPNMAAIFADARTNAPNITGINFSDGTGDSTTIGELVNRENYNVFTRWSMSYSVNWEKDNVFIRGILAQRGQTLTATWARHDERTLQHLGAGETMGEAHRLSQANALNYTASITDETYFALLGDPTLRMLVVAPPQQLLATASGAQTALNWTASADVSEAGFKGYRIYKRPTGSNGAFAFVDETNAGDTDFTDSETPGTYEYMVRAVKLESTPSGSYYNMSQGAFSNQLVVTLAADENNSNTAPNDLSLREAIGLVGGFTGLVGPVTITFDNNLWADGHADIVLGDTSGDGIFDVTPTQLTISQLGLSIVGPGANKLTIDASGAASAFSIVPGIKDTSIKSLSVKGAASQGVNIAYGGGSSAGKVTLDRLEVFDNMVGIAAYDVTNPITISNSTIAENSSTGVTLTYVSANILNTTISGNQSAGFAGGVYVSGGSATIVNSTVTNNRSASYGAGGLFSWGTITVHNSIVAGNFAGPVGNDVDSDLSTWGGIAGTYNLIGVGVSGGPADGVQGNKVGTSVLPKDPGLVLSLAYNGGSTRTHKLLATSDAVNNGDNSIADFYDLAYDQRGRDRTDDGDTNQFDTVDIGAFELAFEEF
jgi:hypothetical protein